MNTMPRCILIATIFQICYNIRKRSRIMCDIENEINKLRDNKWLPNGFEISEDIKECIANCTSPDKKDIFKAFTIFKPEETRILILGQDPYPNAEKAQGLAFSHDKWKKIDASLANIFKAIKDYQLKNDNNINKEIKWETDLTTWASNNGVLLLNTSLTYKQKKLFSQHKNAWKPFFDTIINKVLELENKKLAIFLWGVPAQQSFYKSIKGHQFKEKFLNQLDNNEKSNIEEEKLVNKNKPIEIGYIRIFITSHPSPQGVYRGFKDNAPNHFKACDEFLEDKVWLDFPENNKLD